MAPKQESAYTEYVRWQKELGAKPEAVRAALRLARTEPAVSGEQFRRLLMDYARGR